MQSIVKGNMDEGKSPQDVEFNYRDFVRVSLSISQIHYGVRVNVRLTVIHQIYLSLAKFFFPCKLCG